MTEKEYREAPGINKSTLWNIRRSPAHYKYFLDHPQEDRPAFQFGRAVHSSILTPTAYKRDFAVMPEGIDRRSKAGKEAYEVFCQEAEGREIISAADAAVIKQITTVVKKNKDVMNLLKGTRREKPIFWVDNNGLKCKCRVDAIGSGRIIDIKTATDAGTDTFTHEAIKYGYHVQAAHYIDAYHHTVSMKNPDWYFIVIEKAEPFAINILKADLGFIDYGFFVRDKLLSILMQCQKEEFFPSYGINDLCLPGYVAEDY